MTKTTKTCECWKCNGTGFIKEFAGIANGVCFKCNGSGKIAYRATKKVVKPLSDYAAKINEMIRSGDLSNLNYSQLLALRNAAHYPCEHFPNILDVWYERGEAIFQAAQEERLNAYQR